jgi:glyoxylase-like metal-dependent hydrolase (beta-lactamase superfamily II)
MTGAANQMPEVVTISTPALAVRDSDQISTGSLTVTVMPTPGHTPGHLSYVLSETGQDPVAVFTGGSMLYGAVGPDGGSSTSMTTGKTPRGPGCPSKGTLVPSASAAPAMK